MPSQEYLQELAEKIDDIEIGLDHAFKFNCKGCGNCCKNRDDIMLNGRDLYNIAQYLNMKTADVIKKYCELFIGGSSRIPIIRLKPVGQNKICPLLQGNRCIVHAAKPGVCALFPLGRFIKFPAEINGDIKDLNEDDFVIRYLITEAACGEDQNNTVRSWIESFGIDPDDRWYRLWSKMTMQLSEYI
ncbi:MAG: YkgJ family cysteine cluster protein, partial [Clostridiales bacterium]|nr:YkgJ family cysteine cluster protein [Clostridiales bacterium]